MNNNCCIFNIGVIALEVSKPKHRAHQNFSKLKGLACERMTVLLSFCYLFPFSCCPLRMMFMRSTSPKFFEFYGIDRALNQAMLTAPGIFSSYHLMKIMSISRACHNTCSLLKSYTSLVQGHFFLQ